MKKLLYITQWPSDATAFYRLTPLQYLTKDIEVTFKHMAGQIDWSTFIGYDILLLERPSSGNDLVLIKLAKECGLRVIIDFDDDVLNVDQYNPMYGHYEGNRAVILDCLMTADEVWVSTAGVKKSFGMYNSNIHIIPNAHDNYLFPLKGKKPFNHNGKTVVWRGGCSHEADVYEVADSLIATINGNKDWMFEFIGDRFIYMEQRCGDNYQPVSQMSLMQYFKYMHNLNPQVLICPLSDTKFNEGKSNIAWLEASYSGAVFFGKPSLNEFQNPGTNNFDLLNDTLQTGVLEGDNEWSWDYICSNLLLSNINELRKERILA